MTVQDSWTIDDLVEAYKHHQRRTRGLRERTLRGYERYIRLLVRAALGNDPIDPTHLSQQDVSEFVLSMSGRFTPQSLKVVCSALRSFFRFLRVEDLCDGRLEVAIPRVAHWRRSTLPRYLSDKHLNDVFRALDTSTPYGYRDRAIVLCLASLGIRPGEIAQLRLEDIDWHRGTIGLRTRKTRRGALLPLPNRAGQAIAAYLRHQRPATHGRHVFVKHVGPHRGGPISSTAVSEVVARALRRAKVDPPIAGAYVFRHTVASRLVQRGTSLKEVADFLGHRSLDMTAIYAKLDLRALRDVALPWPEEVR